MRKRFLSFPLVFLVLLMSSLAWGSTQMDQIMQREKIIIAIPDFDYYPFSFEEDGEFKGFDIDLGKRIANELGVKVQFIRASWDGLIALSWYSDYPWTKFDIAIASITVKETRAQVCNISEWYFYTGERLLVRKEDNYSHILDLPGQKIGVVAGSTSYDTAKKELAAHTISYPTPDKAVLALLNREVDAVLTDGVIVLNAIKENNMLTLLGDMLTTEKYAIALPQGAQDLKIVLDKVVVENRKELYEKWFKN